MIILRRLTLPVSVFVLVWLGHYLWLALFPENAAVQGQWISIEDSVTQTVWQRYLISNGFYLSYTYALSLAFAATTYRQYREKKSCTTRRVALGSIGVSGVLGVGSCFLLGCCGSPMLGVYLSLFGARFVLFAKPAIAVISTMLLSVAWYLTRQKESLPVATSSGDCGCESVAGVQDQN